MAELIVRNSLKAPSLCLSLTLPPLCVCVNQRDPNCNRNTYRLVVLQGDPDIQPKQFPGYSPTSPSVVSLR